MGSVAGAAVAFLVAAPLVAAAAQHVHIFSNFFDPEEKTIALGDTVTWDIHNGVHTTTDELCPRAGGAGPCEWDSLAMGVGQSFTDAFNTGNVFEYLCTIHGFTGVLIVDDPAEAPDLVVDGLQVFNLSLTTKRIQVTVKNLGPDGAAGSRVLVGYWYQGALQTIQEPQVPPIRIGDTKTFNVVWTVTGKIGDFTIEARADSQAAVTEGDETNNARQTTYSLVTPAGLVPGIDLLDPV